MLNLIKNGNRIDIKKIPRLTKKCVQSFATKDYRQTKTLNLEKFTIFSLTAAAVLVFGYRLVTSPNQWALSSDVSLREKYNFIGSVVEKCAPAVVYIEIHDPRRIDPETNERMIVSNGSGFLINSEGLILTNAHVVINKPNAVIAVKLNNGMNYTASIEDADMNIDLALIKIKSLGKLPALKFAKSDDVKIGEWVVALGSPLSLSHSVTAGIISSTSRAADELGLRNHSMRYIQTDASITFGNSGGPLVNLDGEVIGINNLRITAGISFAIPIDYAKKFLENGKYKRNDGGSSEIVYAKQLGLATITLNEVIIKELSDVQHPSSATISKGVLVWNIIVGSPAQKSGLEVGDVITRINGISVVDAVDIYKIIKHSETNVCKIEVLRKGEKKKIMLNFK